MFLRYGLAPTPANYDAAYQGGLAASVQAVIPNTTPGLYYVLVRGSTNPVHLLAQLLPFEITDVTPDTGGDSRYVTTVISGAQFDPKAWADMQSTNTRECSSPSSIFAGMLSPGLITHSSNHTFNPFCRNRSASGRTTALSLVLWLRKTSNLKSDVSGIAGHP